MTTTNQVVPNPAFVFTSEAIAATVSEHITASTRERTQAEQAAQDAVTDWINNFQLTPESILQLMMMRLGDMDQQIAQNIAQLNSRQDKTTPLMDQINELRELKRNAPTSKRNDSVMKDNFVPKDGREVRPSKQDLDDAYARLVATGQSGNPGASTPVYGKDVPNNLAEQFKQIVKDVMLEKHSVETLGAVAARHEIGDLSDKDWEKQIDTRIEELQTKIQSLNTENEMSMVKLQSMMQQRTSIIQLGSNMLKSLDEANDTIVGNMR